MKLFYNFAAIFQFKPLLFRLVEYFRCKKEKDNYAF